MKLCRRCFSVRVAKGDSFCPACLGQARSDAAWDSYMFRETVQDEGRDAAMRDQDVTDLNRTSKSG